MKENKSLEQWLSGLLIFGMSLLTLTCSGILFKEAYYTTSNELASGYFMIGIILLMVGGFTNVMFWLGLKS